MLTNKFLLRQAESTQVVEKRGFWKFHIDWDAREAGEVAECKRGAEKSPPREGTYISGLRVTHHSYRSDRMVLFSDQAAKLFGYVLRDQIPAFFGEPVQIYLVPTVPLIHSKMWKLPKTAP